jgi:hypothetical protein
MLVLNNLFLNINIARALLLLNIITYGIIRLAKTLTFTRYQLKTSKDGLSRELSRVKTTRDLLINRVGRSLRQKRVVLGSITKPPNVYKYALRRAHRINVYKYTSRRAHRTTNSSFFSSSSLKHRLLYASYRRALPLRDTSSFFTRLDASFLFSSFSISTTTRN